MLDCCVVKNTAYIMPGNPQENGYYASFNARLRDERPNGEILLLLEEVRNVFENGRIAIIGKEHTIRRALVLLEDWKSGHYLEAMGEPVVGWRAGQVVEWTYDTPHSAANVGFADRYTLQITGHID